MPAWECYNIQMACIIPELDQTWTRHAETIMSAGHSMKIIASGDACCNSPGTHSKLLIAQKTVRVTAVKNSYWMEVEGLKCCLNNISDDGVEISSLATERWHLA